MKRPVTVPLALALAFGGGCPKDEAAQPRDAPREFRAPRVAKAARPDLRAVVYDTLDDVSHDPAGAVESELVQVLLDALDAEDIGKPERRKPAAQAAIRQLLDAASTFKGAHATAGVVRRRALRQQSATLLRELYEATEHGQAHAPSFGPRPEGYARVQWGQLTEVAFEPGTALPEPVQALGGTKVAMGGYLVEGAFDELLLVKSVWGCCFGDPPEIHEAVVVTVDGPPLDPWFDSVVRVMGTLEVGPEYDEGELVSLYRLRATAVDTLR